MAERRLVSFARFGDAMSADAFIAFLAAHEIAAHVEGADPLAIGLGGRVRVVLAEEDARRARWMVEQADVPDAEAWLLATGELDPEAAKRAFAPRELTRGARRGRIAALVLAGVLLAAALLSR